MEASLALQRAVVAAWASDMALQQMGLRLFDGPPADARPPYASVGPDTVTVRNWVGTDACEHRFTLTFWDSSSGVSVLKTYMAEAERVVLRLARQLDGWRLVSLRLVRATVKPNPKNWNQGVLEFRALTERES